MAITNNTINTENSVNKKCAYCIVGDIIIEVL